ncbi:MAG: hypothetical protein CM1200mP23_0400 [Nitrososphaerota archaeon]|nr:MAG: hypothetical protein CM1200mP23_0400 [Nitrososphaerota archaeon]
MFKKIFPTGKGVIIFGKNKTISPLKPKTIWAKPKPSGQNPKNHPGAKPKKGQKTGLNKMKTN